MVPGKLNRHAVLLAILILPYTYQLIGTTCSNLNPPDVDHHSQFVLHKVILMGTLTSSGR